VYTLNGRHVRTLWSGPLHAGDTQFTWDGTDAQARPVASGIYLVQFSSGADHASVRMVLLR
jgi:flagellar hook assembly protein FlgD